MKYICTNPFPNPPGNPIVIADIKDDAGKVLTRQSSVDKRHVHKGAIFHIGTATEFNDLAPAEKTLVSQLMVAHKIAEATPANVERISKEVAADQAREAKDAARDKKADPLAVLAEVLKQNNELLAAVAPKLK